MTYDPTKYAKNRHDLLWVGVDLDETLAYTVWPEPGIGEPIHENVAKLREVHAAGYKIRIFTARPWSDYHNIERWLKDHDIPFKSIDCGKPLYLLIIDDKAVNASEKSWLPKHNH